ncbi:hypothetical protein PENANT_c003G07906 [Penicillium antarcticum]|uniref:Apple domain-containing protein n=1 Tax=Penicillium antarcticum TaxID=416450 RepID=A0A1V6QHS1_9EURO|nr:uncharacterized protein N7508_005928 [Penicillium antarcticum]KAJ5306913.1 hypothetical protein N7508_005928 [Penicillium antarcticum]OQD88768.1 hypothetical protein PENANT_c003G07906 [Penicillium antarcticum]
MSFSRFVFAAGLLLGQVSATSSAASSQVASSQVHVHTANCRTHLGTSSVKAVPTTTITRTYHDPSPVVVFSTTQETLTVTPAVSIETITDYETTTLLSTADVITDTFSTTSTEYDTATLTLTPALITATVFATVSSTSTVTSTVATSAGFTPIADTIATPTVYKRSLEQEEEEQCSPWLDDYEYPQKVVCHEKRVIKTTTVSTVTAAPATITAATPFTTVTVTNTITSNSVVLPSDVSTTLSYSTTSTITETSTAVAETDTVTSTSTILAGVTTTAAYAACATNNIAGSPLSSDFGSYAGYYISSLTFSHVPGESLSVGNTDSPYDCCVSCIEASNCAMSYYWSSGSVKYCYKIATSVCSTSSTYGTANLQSSYSGTQLSNGNCGYIKASV